MTRADIAKLAGIEQATVSRLLTGKFGQAGTWEKLLDALGLELIAVPKAQIKQAVIKEKEPPQ